MPESSGPMTDSNQTSGAAKSRRWFRRSWVLAVAAVLLIVGGFWANHRWERAKGRREIDKRLAALRAMGVAVTPAELAAKFPDPPPGKDAAKLLQPGLGLRECSLTNAVVPAFVEPHHVHEQELAVRPESQG